MMINIAFGLDDKYAKYCAVTVASILVNHKTISDQDDIHFFFIGNISPDSKEKLLTLKKLLPFRHTFINLENDGEFDNFPLGRWNKSILNRLLIPEILPENIDKVIYLDSDIIVNSDIEKLWNNNIDNYLIAAIRDVPYKDHKESYFNSGVLVLNIKNLKAFGFRNNWRDYIKKHPNLDDLEFPDQDILNAVITDRVLFLPVEYNMLSAYAADYLSEHKNISDIVIIHYAGIKPWEPACTHPLRNLYFKYADMNPWKINSGMNKVKNYFMYTIGFLCKHPLFFLQPKYWRIIKNAILKNK